MNVQRVAFIKNGEVAQICAIDIDGEMGDSAASWSETFGYDSYAIIANEDPMVAIEVGAVVSKTVEVLAADQPQAVEADAFQVEIMEANNPPEATPLEKLSVKALDAIRDTINIEEQAFKSLSDIAIIEEKAI